MMCRFFATLLVFLISLSLVKSQDSSKFFTLAMRPMKALVGGFRIDAEMQIARSNHWIQVGGELYSKSISRYKQGERDIRGKKLDYIGEGFGISLLYKYYLDPRRKGKGFYCMTGPTFESYRFDYKDNGWVKFEEDGFVKYNQQLLPFEDKVKTISYTSAIGFQWYIFKYVFLDVNVGLGIRKAIFKSDIPNKENPFTNMPWDFGKSGTFPVFATRVGVLLF